MKRNERHPLFMEFLEKSYNGNQRLVTRAKNAINWSSVYYRRGKYNLFDMATDEVIVAMLYLFTRRELYNIRNMGRATVDDLYDFMHSDEGRTFYIDKGLERLEIYQSAVRLKRIVYGEYV